MFNQVAVGWGRNPPGFQFFILTPALLVSWGERRGCALAVMWGRWGVWIQVATR